MVMIDAHDLPGADLFLVFADFNGEGKEEYVGGFPNRCTAALEMDT